jgi:hypothetical protein
MRGCRVVRIRPCPRDGPPPPPPPAWTSHPRLHAACRDPVVHIGATAESASRLCLSARARGGSPSTSSGACPRPRTRPLTAPPRLQPPATGGCDGLKNHGPSSARRFVLHGASERTAPCRARRGWWDELTRSWSISCTYGPDDVAPTRMMDESHLGICLPPLHIISLYQPN